MRRAIAVFTLLVQGCSFLLVSGPPSNHRQLPYFDCTSSNLAPILDTVFTALETLNLVVAGTRTDQQWHDTFCDAADSTCKPPISRGAAIPLYAGLAVLGGAGMYFGYTRTSQCRAAKSELAVRASVAPGVGTWPPPAPAGPPGAPATPGPAPAPPAPAPAPPAPPAPPPASPPAPAPTP